jgi:site-specific DNA recombinase
MSHDDALQGASPRRGIAHVVTSALKLVSLLADAHRWVDDLAKGQAISVRDLAQQNHRDPSEVSRTLPLAFLAPDIVDAILDGRQPLDLTPHELKRLVLPLRWDDQRRRLGFTT